MVFKHISKITYDNIRNIWEFRNIKYLLTDLIYLVLEIDSDTCSQTLSQRCHNAHLGSLPNRGTTLRSCVAGWFMMENPKKTWMITDITDITGGIQ